MMEDQYVVLCYEWGVLGIGVIRPYGMDIRAFREGIEFAQEFDDPSEYHIVGRLEEIEHPLD